MQPFLNGFPLPNRPGLGNGVAEFNASYSNAASLDASSLRIDQRLNNKLSLFGRFNYSPSEINSRGNGHDLSVIQSSRITTDTATVGATWAASQALTDDLRFNYSRTSASGGFSEDNFGGAVPLTSLPFPTGFDSSNALFEFRILSLRNNLGLAQGKQTGNHQSQVNLVDDLSVQTGSHAVKFGADYRELLPLLSPLAYQQEPLFSSVPSAESGTVRFSILAASQGAALLFKNLGLFAQDTWRATPRLTLTYGLRWDVDFAPLPRSGPGLPAVSGFDLNNLADLALAPSGVEPFNTTYGNIAPRIGVAYQISQHQNWSTVLRGGFGEFFDLITSQAGNALNAFQYPFGAQALSFGGTFPLSSAAAAPPAITPPTASNNQPLFAFDPNIRLPYSLEWNIAVEQELGKEQTLSTSYVGSVGRRLLQTAVIISPNPNLAQADLIANSASSNYNALQLQFQRRLSRGIQVLASYIWAHSIDDGSAGSGVLTSNLGVPGSGPNANRGPSDFDIRNAFSAAVTYDVPAPKVNVLTNAILRGWSLQSLIQARSAPPVDIAESTAVFSQLDTGVQADIRPDIVPGQPFYLFGAKCTAVFGPLGLPCAGGKGFNPAAFTDPPVNPNTGNPLRQGNVPRNFLRGFGAAQWDFAVHREFSIREPLKLQFRAEMFNVLNHPNFGQPSGAFISPQNGGPAGFGVATTMLGQFLNGGSSGLSNVGGGAFSPLYQIGGPRSMQFALKVMF